MTGYFCWPFFIAQTCPKFAMNLLCFWVVSWMCSVSTDRDFL